MDSDLPSLGPTATAPADATPSTVPTTSPAPTFYAPVSGPQPEPASSPLAGRQPAPKRTTGRRAFVGALGLALAVAALSSGGTLAALGAAGVFDHGAATVSTPSVQAQLASTGNSAPSSSSGSAALAVPNDAVVTAAADVSPAVVTIVSSSAAGSANGNGSGQGVDPFGNGQNPFGNGQNPFGNGQDPFGNGNGSNGNGSNGNGSNGNGSNGSSGQTPYGIPSGQTPVSVGSGVIFDSNGWILTNHHVVADAGTLTVQLSDGRSFPAKVYGTDTLTDLAIVKIDATGLTAAQFGDSSALKVGQLVIAVGDPLGQYPGTVTTGVVSGLGRSLADSTGSLDNLIQTDAAINPGNSGGPLVDQNGNVVGIDTAIAASAQGIGFAIPIDLARPLTQQALAGQPLSRPWLGVRYQPLDAGLAARNGLSVSEGAWITSGGSGAAVESGSPAAKAGLVENDVITAVDGTKVDVQHPLVSLIAQHAPGSTVTLTVHRGSTDTQVQVTLTTRAATNG